ncbi:putative glycoside hydrolase [Calorimonas adulescens]|nr:putative glycoside hydrolase [Calorimonas adulescens]
MKKTKITGILMVILFSLILAVLFLLKGYSKTGAYENNLPSYQELVDEKLVIHKADRDEALKKLNEWKENDKILREKLKEYYVPLPKEETPKPNPPIVKGIYVTGDIAGSKKNIEHLVDLLDNSELNTMVIDVKDDNGLMTYKSNIQIVNDVDANRYVRINDIQSFIKNLQEHNIYPIARIVTFKDRNLSEHRPDLSIQKKSGGIWRDRKGVSWVNPYDKRVWDYNIAIAKEAALNGFKEIQFDYVRFPENGTMVDAEAFFPGQDGKPKEDCIAEFLSYAKEQLKAYNVVISADVFGLTTSVEDDMNIGQKWEKISPAVDYISPMIYPSHYYSGNYGFDNPNAHPYEVIDRAIKDAIKKNEKLQKKAIIRPWIQDFTLGKPKYTGEDVLKQIKALKDNGIENYMLWNAGNKYSEDVFRK